MIDYRIKGINRLISRTYLKHDIFYLGKARAFRKADACMDAGGRAKHDSRDGGGRNASGTAFEEPEPRLHESMPLRDTAFEKGENDA